MKSFRYIALIAVLALPVLSHAGVLKFSFHKAAQPVAKASVKASKGVAKAASAAAKFGKRVVW